jgi:glycosyltransferase involved in cell wall biosynthesis
MEINCTKPVPSMTVLTTVYNGLPYLAECIDSVLNQTERDFEFLIIDDASTDNSLECIKSYKDPRIKIVENEENIGQVPSLNIGLKIARGEFIARLDQDDVCLPNRLEEQADFLQKNSDISILCSWEITIDSSGKKVRSWKGSLKNYGFFLATVLLGLCPVWHPSVMFRKDAVLNLDGFDTSYAPAEDYELWARMALGRLNGAIVPRFHLLQRVHSQRQSVLQGDKQLNAACRAHNELISKFMPDVNVECLAALLRLEGDPCGRSYDKEHIRELASNLATMLQNVKTKQRLSGVELRSLKNKICQRVGLGVIFGRRLACLPEILFYPAFYLLSPLLFPGIRRTLSKAHYFIHKLRYIFKA